MTQTELYLVRHGQTDWNAEGRWQGHLNSQLTPLGITQAKAAADRLEKVSFTTLYASDLARTYDTAQQISTVTGHRIITDQRLRERCGGVREGLTEAEAKEKLPEFFADDVNRWAPDFAFPGGESTLQLLDRAVGVFSDIGQRHTGERVVIVSHGAIIGTFLRYVLNIPQTDYPFRMSNCSLSIVLHGEFFDSNWMVGTLNETGYLDGLESAKKETK